MVQEFASERELCWHLCVTLGLAKQYERLAQALAQTGINEQDQPSEYRAQAQARLLATPGPHASSAFSACVSCRSMQRIPTALHKQPEDQCAAATSVSHSNRC